ncbi:MAG: hypothetical protein SV775_15355 [Thermodesulfobacteriota bacterium]|nr:hypothetical protein [Thermodesulfobacteriota bacterium]
MMCVIMPEAAAPPFVVSSSIFWPASKVIENKATLKLWTVAD